MADFVRRSDVSATTLYQSQSIVMHKGSPLKFMESLLEVIVENSYFVPDHAMFTLHLAEKFDEAIGNFQLADEVEIDIKALGETQAVSIFKGEIVSIEPTFAADQTLYLTIRAYDKSHRMLRETRTKAFIDKKDSDIARDIAGDYGLSSAIDQTQTVFEHIYQDAQSDMEFLQYRASRIGYEFYVTDGKLYFAKPKTEPTGSPVILHYNEQLLSFAVRRNGIDQVDEVEVRGWDVTKKEAIVQSKKTSKTQPENGFGKWGGADTKKEFSAARKIQTRVWVQETGDAANVAQGILDDINNAYMEAEGKCHGNPNIGVGTFVEIDEIGDSLAGTYKVTSTRHEYSSNGYVTYFTVEGSRPRSLSAVLGPEQKRIWPGVMPAIVTNVMDDKQMARVKVKYPYLSEDVESGWVRVAMLGGGPETGFIFLPEINDEVLVAFENGDFNRPYVIGGLINGVDKVPAELTVEGDRIQSRVLQTRLGHKIILDDGGAGDEMIKIVDSTGEHFFQMNVTQKKLTISTTGEMVIEAEKDISITSKTGNVSIDAKQKSVNIKATQNVSAEATQNVSIKASSNATMEGTAGVSIKSTGSTSVEGTAGLKLQSAAIAQLQGSLVKIN
jgi:phage protein D/phage baseplate assembly protein gpV